jgi:hypothetical protein
MAVETIVISRATIAIEAITKAMMNGRNDFDCGGMVSKPRVARSNDGGNRFCQVAPDRSMAAGGVIAGLPGKVNPRTAPISKETNRTPLDAASTCRHRPMRLS